MSALAAVPRAEEPTDTIVSFLAGAAITVGVFLVLWPFGAVIALGTFGGLLFVLFGGIPAAVIAALDGLLIGLPLVLLARWVVRRAASPIVHGLAHLTAGLVAALIPLAAWWLLYENGLLALWMRVGEAPWFVATVLICVSIATLAGWRATERMLASGRQEPTPGWPETLDLR